MDDQSPQEKAKDLLRERKLAYEHVFGKDTEDVKAVLQDLADFCHANKTTFNKDSTAACNLDGRREVWLRIQKYLRTDLQDLWSQTGVD